MTKDEFLKYHAHFCSQMLEISKVKNSDYTGSNPDPFANFTAVERNGVVSTEQGFLVRMTDKMQRINSFVQKGSLEVQDEKVNDTLMDLANYCILMSAYIWSQHYDEHIGIHEEDTTEISGQHTDSRGRVPPEWP